MRLGSPAASVSALAPPGLASSSPRKGRCAPAFSSACTMRAVRAIHQTRQIGHADRELEIAIKQELQRLASFVAGLVRIGAGRQQHVHDLRRAIEQRQLQRRAARLVRGIVERRLGGQQRRQHARARRQRRGAHRAGARFARHVPIDMLGPGRAVASAARAATAGRRRRSRRDAGRGQGGRECGLVVGRAASNKARTSVFPPWDSRGTATGNRSPGPAPSAPRAEVARHRHRAVRQGHLERTPGAAASKRPRPGFLSFQRPAGRRRAKQSLFAACVCLARDCRTGRLRPDQASCSGRVGLRPDLSDFGLRAARETQLQRLSGLQAGGIAQDASLRVAGNRISRASVLPGSSARSCAGGNQPVARLQAQPRVGLAQLPRGVRHAFGRAARVGLAMFQALRERRDARAARADRRTPAGSPGCSGARADVPGAAPATPAGRRRGRGAGRPAPAAAAGRAPACAPSMTRPSTRRAGAEPAPPPRSGWARAGRPRSPRW